MPKPPKVSYPHTPTTASYASAGTAGQASKAQRPNKLINPILGFSASSTSAAPTLLGGI